jgi:hypothetical protein
MATENEDIQIDVKLKVSDDGSVQGAEKVLSDVSRAVEKHVRKIEGIAKRGGIAKALSGMGAGSGFQREMDTAGGAVNKFFANLSAKANKARSDLRNIANGFDALTARINATARAMQSMASIKVSSLPVMWGQNRQTPNTAVYAAQQRAIMGRNVINPILPDVSRVIRSYIAGQIVSMREHFALSVSRELSRPSFQMGSSYGPVYTGGARTQSRLALPYSTGGNFQLVGNQPPIPGSRAARLSQPSGAITVINSGSLAPLAGMKSAGNNFGTSAANPYVFINPTARGRGYNAPGYGAGALPPRGGFPPPPTGGGGGGTPPPGATSPIPPSASGETLRFTGKLSALSQAMNNAGYAALSFIRIGLRVLVAEFTAATAAALALAKSFIEINEKFAQFEITLTSVFKNTADARAVREEVAQISAKSPLPFEDIANITRSAAVNPAFRSKITEQVSTGQLGNENGFLRRMTTLVEQMIAFRPDKKAEDAIFSIREAASGQFRSLIRRFDVSLPTISAISGVSPAEMKASPDKAFEAMETFFGSLIDKEAIRKAALQPSRLFETVVEQMLTIPLLKIGSTKVQGGKQTFYEQSFEPLRNLYDQAVAFTSGNSKGSAPVDMYAEQAAGRLSSIFEKVISFFSKGIESLLSRFGLDSASDSSPLIERMAKLTIKGLEYLDANIIPLLEEASKILTSVFTALQKLANMVLNFIRTFGPIVASNPLGAIAAAGAVVPASKLLLSNGLQTLGNLPGRAPIGQGAVLAGGAGLGANVASVAAMASAVIVSIAGGAAVGLLINAIADKYTNGGFSKGVQKVFENESVQQNDIAAFGDQRIQRMLQNRDKGALEGEIAKVQRIVDLSNKNVGMLDFPQKANDLKLMMQGFGPSGSDPFDKAKIEDFENYLQRLKNAVGLYSMKTEELAKIEAEKAAQERLILQRDTVQSLQERSLSKGISGDIFQDIRDSERFPNLAKTGRIENSLASVQSVQGSDALAEFSDGMEGLSQPFMKLQDSLSERAKVVSQVKADIETVGRLAGGSDKEQLRQMAAEYRSIFQELKSKESVLKDTNVVLRGVTMSYEEAVAQVERSINALGGVGGDLDNFTKTLKDTRLTSGKTALFQAALDNNKSVGMALDTFGGLMKDFEGTDKLRSMYVEQLRETLEKTGVPFTKQMQELADVAVSYANDNPDNIKKGQENMEKLKQAVLDASSRMIQGVANGLSGPIQTATPTGPGQAFTLPSGAPRGGTPKSIAANAEGFISMRGTSFATDQDVARYKAAKAQGMTDREAFRYGDNGLGASGRITNNYQTPMVALPSNLIKQLFGSLKQGWGQEVEVMSPLNGARFKASVEDHSGTNPVIDLNPAAALMAGASEDNVDKPPFDQMMFRALGTKNVSFDPSDAVKQNEVQIEMSKGRIESMQRAAAQNKTESKTYMMAVQDAVASLENMLGGLDSLKDGKFTQMMKSDVLDKIKAIPALSPDTFKNVDTLFTNVEKFGNQGVDVLVKKLNEAGTIADKVADALELAATKTTDLEDQNRLKDQAQKFRFQGAQMVDRAKDLSPVEKNPIQTFGEGALGEWKQPEGYFNNLAKEGQAAAELIRGSFANAFAGFVMGTMSAKDAFKSFVGSVLEGLAKMAAEKASEAIFALIGNVASSALGGGGTGGSWFSGAATTAGTTAVKTFASGGRIEGGTGARDDVPILAMGGEYIIRKSAVQKYGNGLLQAINEERIQQFNTGGYVQPVQTFAEGGVVKPVGREAASEKFGDTFKVDVNVKVGEGRDDKDGDTAQNKEKQARELGKAVRTSVMAELERQQRPGGMLYRDRRR